MAYTVRLVPSLVLDHSQAQGNAGSLRPRTQLHLFAHQVSIAAEIGHASLSFGWRRV